MHEEPQTQFYYAMKSSYFHLSLMYDLIQLISSDYEWQKEDMTGRDDRQNEALHIAAGFDYGNYAIEYAIVSLNYGIRRNDLFHSGSVDMGRWGISYTNRFFESSFYLGIGDGEDQKEEELVAGDGAPQWEIDYVNAYNEALRKKPDFEVEYGYVRFNLAFPDVRLQPRYSLIYRLIDFDKKQYDGTPIFQYQGESLTNALYFHHDLNGGELFIDTLLSVEMTKNRSGIDDFDETSQHTYFKGGINLGLLF